MSDWFHDLPVPWMALLIFGFTYLIAAMVYAVVSVLAVGERTRAFKAVSPGMLPPLGITAFSLHSWPPKSGTIMTVRLPRSAARPGH